MTGQTGSSHSSTQGSITIGTSATGAAASRVNMTESAFIIMDNGNHTAARVATGVVAVGDINKIRHRMTTGMQDMAIQTTDSQAVVLNDCSHTAVTSLNIGGPSRIVTGSAGTMQGEDAIGTGPVVAIKQRIGRLGAATTVTGITGIAGALIGSPLQDGMCCVGVLGVASKVSGMTIFTLTTCRMIGCVTLQGTIILIAKDMAVETISMHLTTTNKRSRGCHMTT
jgi:hypothetical protein